MSTVNNYKSSPYNFFTYLDKNFLARAKTQIMFTILHQKHKDYSETIGVVHPHFLSTLLLLK